MNMFSVASLLHSLQFNLTVLREVDYLLLKACLLAKRESEIRSFLRTSPQAAHKRYSIRSGEVYYRGRVKWLRVFTGLGSAFLYSYRTTVK